LRSSARVPLLALVNGVAVRPCPVGPAESRLLVADSLDDLRDLLPAELYDLVAHAADQPPVEDLDI